MKPKIKKYLYKEYVYHKFSDINKHPSLSGSKSGILSFIKKKQMVWKEDYLIIRTSDLKAVKTYSKKSTIIVISRDWLKANDPYKDLPVLPNELKLEDHECFRDDEDRIYKVDVRGERHYKKCFFKVVDIAEVFEMPNLVNTVHNNYTSYVNGEDYVEFNSPFPYNILKVANRDDRIYFTYTGLIRAIGASRTGNGRRFVNWMMETLFTAQFGTSESKVKLASNLTGLDYDAVKTLCKISCNKISAIYLFYLGMVKDLRGLLDIPDLWDDNLCVFKYGRTNDIGRRYRDHLGAKYSNNKGYETTLVGMWFISTEMCPRAELDLTHYLKENKMKLSNNNHTEIAIYGTKPNHLQSRLKHLFSEYNNQTRSLEDKILKLENEIALLKSDLIAKDNKIESYEIKLHSKDLEIELIRTKCS